MYWCCESLSAQSHLLLLQGAHRHYVAALIMQRPSLISSLCLELHKPSRLANEHAQGVVEQICAIFWLHSPQKAHVLGAPYTDVTGELLAGQYAKVSLQSAALGLHDHEML